MLARSAAEGSGVAHSRGDVLLSNHGRKGCVSWSNLVPEERFWLKAAQLARRHRKGRKESLQYK